MGKEKGRVQEGGVNPQVARDISYHSFASMLGYGEADGFNPGLCLERDGRSRGEHG